VPESKSDEELAERLRHICRELLARRDEPDIAERTVAALGPFFPKTDDE
jgi:hypothetical protein